MGISLQERLTIQFYEWEKRGRGWYVFDQPVHLEPEYMPFFGHLDPTPTVFDDGERKTIFNRLSEIFNPPKHIEIIDKSDQYDEVTAYPYIETESLKALRVVVPRNIKIPHEASESLLLMLSSCEYPVSYEMIGTKERIVIQFVCRASDYWVIYNQIKAYFPFVYITEKLEYLDQVSNTTGYGYAMDYGLSEESMRPLGYISDNKLDTFTSLFGVMNNLRAGERITLQVLFEKVVNPWSSSIKRSVVDGKGDSFFMDAPEMIKITDSKIASPLYAVCVRLLASSETEPGAALLMKQAESTLIQSTASPFNRLLPMETDLYDFSTRISDIRGRQSHRVGMLLNVKELATLVHFPNETIQSNKLEQETRKTFPVSVSENKVGALLGKNEHQGVVIDAIVPEVDRLKHMHIVGGTGVGKSTLILQLIKQDIQSGKGVCVLDPHGDLVESVVSLIPENRINDVLIIDPSDGEFPVAFNILEAHSDIEKEILSSDLVSSFKRLSTSWGDQMNSVLANAILAFLESSRGGTLTDLRRFLIEKDFRNDFLKSVTDPSIQYYWLKEYPLLKSNSIGSILTRLDTFLRPKVIRNMVAQKKGINFEHLINTNKIVLVKLSQGLIGVENSYLLGTFVVSKIHQAVMARQAMDKQSRTPFYLYIDEFQNFITPSMGAILSGARKYSLGLVLAHQDLAQLVKNDSELASGVLANAGTRICFRLNDTDAKRLADGFSHFEFTDLQNLGVGQAIARIGRPDSDFNVDTLPFDVPQNQIIYQKVIDTSRQQYASSREEVEKILLQSYESVVIDVPEVKHVAKFEEAKSEKVITVDETPTIEVHNERLKESIVKRAEVSKHRYIQTLVKRMAEQRGYKALIEEELPDKSGRVDVHIEGFGKKIACEVSVTTTNEWELRNINKCLNAGYDIVFECLNNKSNIPALVSLIQNEIAPALQQKVFVGEPEDLFKVLEYLQQPVEEKPKETIIKGYRVNIEYNTATDEDMQRRKESIAKIVRDNLHKFKK